MVVINLFGVGRPFNFTLLTPQILYARATFYSSRAQFSFPKRFIPCKQFTGKMLFGNFLRRNYRTSRYMYYRNCRLYRIIRDVLLYLPPSFASRFHSSGALLFLSIRDVKRSTTMPKKRGFAFFAEITTIRCWLFIPRINEIHQFSISAFFLVEDVWQIASCLI